MSILDKIRTQSLQQIRPTESEVKKTYRVFEKVREVLEHEIEVQKIKFAFIELEGSSGQKQTQLRGWNELDVFVGLPVANLPEFPENKSTSKPEIRRYMKRMIKTIALPALNRLQPTEIHVAYAEHPYLIAKIGDYRVDVVFCFDLSKDYIFKHGPITAVDRTPHHSKFVKAHLNTAQRDEVRLLKAFLQSVFVYGDTSPIGRSGFTGFSTEMLIFHKQSLESALEYLTHSTPKPLDFFNRAHELIKRKFSQDFFFISDPIDPNRNIVSSVSKRAYRYTTVKAKEFLKAPSLKFFEKKPVPILSSAEMKRLKPNYFVLEFEDLTGWHYTKTRDKLYRHFTKLSKFLKQEPTGEPRFGSVIFEELFQKNVFAVALFVENDQISQDYTRAGPTEDYVEGSKRFLERHSEAILKNGRYYVTVKREFTDAEKAIRYFLLRNEISPKLRIRDISRTGSSYIGKQALWILIHAVKPFSSHK
jgi:tRNA CCA-adding enzyme